MDHTILANMELANLSGRNAAAIEDVDETLMGMG